MKPDEVRWIMGLKAIKHSFNFGVVTLLLDKNILEQQQQQQKKKPQREYTWDVSNKTSFYKILNY